MIGAPDDKPWFTTEGRASRRPHLVAWLVTLCLLRAGTMVHTDGPEFWVFYAPFLYMSLHATFMITVQRCHDRGRSGCFGLLLLVPVVNLWAAVELACLKGEVGSNRYGADPLAAVRAGGAK